MPLFDFRTDRARVIGAVRLCEENLVIEDYEPGGSLPSAPVPLAQAPTAGPLAAQVDARAGAGASFGRKRARVFDFGDSDDGEPQGQVGHLQTSSLVGGEEMGRSGHRGAAAISRDRSLSLALGSPEECSLTPASQKSHFSQPQSVQRLSAAHPAAVAHGGGSQHVAPASIVERIWQQSSAGAAQRVGGCAVEERDGLQPVSPRGRACVQEHAPVQSLPAKPASAASAQGTLAHRAAKSSVDRIWNELEDLTDASTKRAALTGSQENQHSKSGQFSHSKSGQFRLKEWPVQPVGLSERASQHEESLYSEQSARDAWREKGARLASQREACSAEDHARKILLSPLQTAPRQVPVSQRSARCDADEIVELDPHDVGWGAEISRARGGRGAGMRQVHGGARMSGASVVEDAVSTKDGHRPRVPGPAGKLGRVETCTGRSDGRVSPALQEQSNEEECASREVRVGIVVDALGPQLPLKKKYLVGFFLQSLRSRQCSHVCRLRVHRSFAVSIMFLIHVLGCRLPLSPQAIDPHDADFKAKSWRKMLSDLDLEPFTGHVADLVFFTSSSPGLLVAWIPALALSDAR